MVLLVHEACLLQLSILDPRNYSLLAPLTQWTCPPQTHQHSDLFPALLSDCATSKGTSPKANFLRQSLSLNVACAPCSVRHAYRFHFCFPLRTASFTGSQPHLLFFTACQVFVEGLYRVGALYIFGERLNEWKKTPTLELNLGWIIQKVENVF